MLEEVTWFKEHIAISGINFFIHKNTTFIVSSARPLKVLGSAVLGGDLRSARHIINHTVDKDYNGSDPENDLRQVAGDLGLGNDVMGMMTAVSVTQTFLTHVKYKGFSVCALCTAGIGNPGVAGLSIGKVVNQNNPGTINIILLIDGHLTDAAMVNAVITATEAKTRALFKQGICLPDGEQVTGTTTDSIVVACTERGERFRYAGTGTDLGYLVGRTVYEAVTQGICTYISMSGGEYGLRNKLNILN